MNNPLNSTDPSGYLRILGVRITPRMVVAAVVAYATVGAVNTWMMSGAINAAGGAMAITGAQFATATMTAGIASGAAAGFVGSMVMTNGDVNASLRSAASGAIGGGVSSYFGNNYSIERVASNTFAGGVQSVIRGGEFEDGAKFAAFTSTASYSYDRVVGRPINPGLSNGESASKDGVDIHPSGNYSEMGLAYTREQMLKGVVPSASENSALFRAITSHVPLMNALSVVHDKFGGILERNGYWNTFTPLLNFEWVMLHFKQPMRHDCSFIL